MWSEWRVESVERVSSVESGECIGCEYAAGKRFCVKQERCTSKWSLFQHLALTMILR